MRFAVETQQIDPFFKQIIAGDEKSIVYNNVNRRRSWSNRKHVPSTSVKVSLNMKKRFAMRFEGNQPSVKFRHFTLGRISTARGEGGSYVTTGRGKLHFQNTNKHKIRKLMGGTFDALGREM